MSFTPASMRKQGRQICHPCFLLTEEISAGTASVADFQHATVDGMASGLLMQAVINGWPNARKDCYPLLVDYWTYRDKISAWRTVQGSQGNCP